MNTDAMEPAELDAALEDALGPRDVITVEGSDAQTYLHSQLSQTIDDLGVGERRWSFVLEPTGKVASLMRVTRVGDLRFELDTDAGHGADLLARIDRFKIRVDAATTLVEADAAPDAATETARIKLGWPRLGAEIVPGDTIPAGTGLTGVAVSFTKGCYPGQELVERMDSRSADAPRSLRRLHVAHGASAGDPVVDGDDDVGVITSVAAPHALAWIKRSSELGDIVEF